jgi:hypothetical protein
VINSGHRGNGALIRSLVKNQIGEKRTMIRTVNGLIRATRGTAPYYFCKDTLEFFGDYLENYGVRYRQEFNAYELYRIKPNLNGLTGSSFFDADTFKQRFDLDSNETAGLDKFCNKFLTQNVVRNLNLDGLTSTKKL